MESSRGTGLLLAPAWEHPKTVESCASKLPEEPAYVTKWPEGASSLFRGSADEMLQACLTTPYRDELAQQ